MARKRRQEEHENHERWLVSYADFITLLFAFFVVMYSVSSVNEGKMRVLSDSLVGRFSEREKSLNPIQTGELVRSPVTDTTSNETVPLLLTVPRAVTPETAHGSLGQGAGDAGAFGEVAGEPPAVAGDAEGEAAEEVAEIYLHETPAGQPEAGVATPGGQDESAPMASLDTVADGMQAHVEELMEQGLVDVRRNERWIEVELNNSILFASGDARLSRAAVKVLAELADVLKGFPNPIQVEGFTDDLPISTVAFPSNWELSAARAASVVHLFMQYGVRPDRMVAIGYGEHRSATSNETATGRARNRRVVLVIAADPDTRRVIDLDRGAEQTKQAAMAGSLHSSYRETR